MGYNSSFVKIFQTFYYTRAVTRHDARAYPLRASTVRQPEHAYTETNWEVYPDGLTDTLRWVRDRGSARPACESQWNALGSNNF